MRAWQFTSPEHGLEYVDVDPPIPGPGEVLIDVEAAGICHSDVQIVNGHGDAWLRKHPIILGHEVAGTVRGLGGGVNDIAIGDRVAVALPAPRSNTSTSSTALGSVSTEDLRNRRFRPART